MLPCLCIVIVLVLSYLISTIIKPKNYPPGPRWFPFFGCNNLLNARMVKGTSQWKVISDLADEYSTNVLGLKMGNERVVVVYGEDNIRQVSYDKEFEARPDSFFLRMRCFGKRIGITFVDGMQWKEHRQFAFKLLKNEGYGKQLMHDEIKHALKNITNIIDKSDGDPLNLITTISMSVTNILWKFVAEQTAYIPYNELEDRWYRTKYKNTIFLVQMMVSNHSDDLKPYYITLCEPIKEQRIQRIIDLMSARSKAFTMAGGWLNQWPWLRFIAPDWTGYSVIKKMNIELSDIIEESINKHKQELVKGNDFIYAFLDEMYKQKATYTDDQLKGVCLDFLIASTQTTGNSFGFMILALILNPAMQEKVYQEIITTFGEEDPAYSDFTRLVYTNAFFAETQRYHTVALFSGARRTLSDVDINGYTIPANTTVLVSLGDLHKDTKYWDEPNRFNPERFIDENGKLKMSSYLHPFGLGRRRCPGEPLSRPFLLTTLVTFAKRYKIECSNGVLPSEEPIVGILAAPRPFKARFIKRK